MNIHRQAPATPTLVGSPHRILIWAAAVLVLAIAIPNSVYADGPPAPPSATCADANKQAALQIAGFGDDASIQASTTTGLDQNLVIRLSPASPVVPSCYVLFLNGRAIDGLDGALYEAGRQELIFHLERISSSDIQKDNTAIWTALLGGPSAMSQKMTVALGVRTSDHPAETIFGSKKEDRPVTFVLVTVWRLLFAIVSILIVFGLVWGSAKGTGIMKDNLVPQIEPRRQTYSLARWQMAFWFTLIFASYVFLWILLDDPNTLSSQALTLMGISGATALAATSVDAAKDTPDDSVNQGLRLLGIRSFEDVETIRGEIVSRKAQLANASNPVSATTAAQLNSEILDRQLKLRYYEDAIRPYTTQGWFKDIVTDINGTALHRLQVLVWTALLGVVFLVGVWHDLAMPQFSATLLALMAISSTGYVGFKYSEAQQ